MANDYYNRGAAVTPSDTVNFTYDGSEAPCDALYVGGAGVVVGVWQNGTTSNFPAAAGEILPMRFKRVNSTSTTATLMVALYSV